MNQLDK